MLISSHSPERHSILGYFCDWRADLNGRVDNPESAFFPKGIYDDLNSLVLGFTALARCHLRRFPSSSVVQRRCNQDCCEHHFSHQRQSCGGGVNPTSVQAAQARRVERYPVLRRNSGVRQFTSEATAPLAARLKTRPCSPLNSSVHWPTRWCRQPAPRPAGRSWPSVAPLLPGPARAGWCGVGLVFLCRESFLDEGARKS